MIVIGTSNLRLHVRPDLGAGIASFEGKLRTGSWTHMMRPAPIGCTWFNELACYHLAPWSNRIANASFPFQSALHHLRPDWPDGTAIHGDIKHRQFTVLDRTPASVRLKCDAPHAAGRNWPWAFSCQLRYELLDTTLHIDLLLKNTDQSPFPCGVGFHPFWSSSLAQNERAIVTMCSKGRYPCRDVLPTGTPIHDEVVKAFEKGTDVWAKDLPDLDDVFCGFDGKATIEWPKSGVRVTYECSPQLGHCVVYAPAKASDKHDFFCVEPATMVNNGFNLPGSAEFSTGVRVLQSGEDLSVRWSMQVEGLAKA